MSEVYSFLGLTPAPPKANAPAPSAAHVAAAAATAANSGRAVREAKLSASAAITGTQSVLHSFLLSFLCGMLMEHITESMSTLKHITKVSV